MKAGKTKPIKRRGAAVSTHVSVSSESASSSGEDSALTIADGGLLMAWAAAGVGAVIVGLFWLLVVTLGSPLFAPVAGPPLFASLATPGAVVAGAVAACPVTPFEIECDDTAAMFSLFDPASDVPVCPVVLRGLGLESLGVGGGWKMLEQEARSNNPLPVDEVEESGTGAMFTYWDNSTHFVDMTRTRHRHARNVVVSALALRRVTAKGTHTGRIRFGGKLNWFSNKLDKAARDVAARLEPTEPGSGLENSVQPQYIDLEFRTGVFRESV